MFSWKKEKGTEERAVSEVQKMMKQTNVPKLQYKMRMRSDAVSVLKTHPNMHVHLGTSTCLPQLILEKVRSWQGVNVLKLTGHVKVESSSGSAPRSDPEYSIPLEIVVHPQFPSVPPVCFVTGDLYIPRWTQDSSLIDIIRFWQVLGVILTDGAVDWEAIELQHLASALHESEAGQPLPPQPPANPAPDASEDWEMREAIRAVEEAERRERAAGGASVHGGGGGGAGAPAKHSPLFAATDDTPANFVCPISLEVMTDPVTAADGHTYEREEIEDWLRNHATSPLTNMELAHKELVANSELQQDILRHFQHRDRAGRRFMHM